jgi:hypothetical protein
MAMSQGHDDPAADDIADGGADGVFEVVGDDGKVVLYRQADFDEIFTTTDEHEAGRHVKLGWILLDERVVREGGKPGLDTFLRRVAGRALPAADDPQYAAPKDVTTCVLGYLKEGATGTPAG